MQVVRNKASSERSVKKQAHGRVKTGLKKSFLRNETVSNGYTVHAAPASTEVTSTVSRPSRRSDADIPSYDGFKKLVVKLQESVATISELKDPDLAHRLLLEFLDEGPRNLDSLMKFYTVQRCSSRKLIRKVVERLTVDEAHRALICFCDVSLLVGVALVTVESQHRQAWIMELFRRLPRDRLRGTDFRQGFLRQCQRKAESAVVSYHAMGKLYGRLTTVLDHQYRRQLKQLKSRTEAPVINEAVSQTVLRSPQEPSRNISHSVNSSFPHERMVDTDHDHKAEDQSTDGSEYSTISDTDHSADSVSYSDNDM